MDTLKDYICYNYDAIADELVEIEDWDTLILVQKAYLDQDPEALKKLHQLWK